MNLPPNLGPGVYEHFKNILDRIQFEQKVSKGKIISSTGAVVWEEPEEDYQARMNELFYEVK